MPAQPQLKRLLPALVGVAAFAAFLPALQGEFLSWDDHGNILANPHFRGLGWSQVRWAFTTLYLGPYQPLAWLSFGLDWTLWGLNPVGYHQTNLLIHAGTAVTLYFVAARLLPSRLAAAFAGLVWAVHPLRVESVAWVTERRDVLSGLFYVLAVLQYLRKGSCLGVFVLALLSKGLAFTLPLTLIALDYHRHRRLMLADKWKYALPAAIAVALGLLGQGQAAERLSFAEHGLAARVVQSLYGLWFYAQKTLLPLDLLPLYQLPRPFDPLEPRFAWGAVGGLSLAAACWRAPATRAAFAHYALCLAPVLGLFQAGPQLAADRFAYVASMSVALLAGAAVDRYGRRFAVTAAAIPLALAALTWEQTKVWRTSETLWSYTAAKAPGSSIARESHGAELLEAGRLEEGAVELEAALRLSPRSVNALNNLAYAKSAQGDKARAVELYEAALALRPGDARIRSNLAAERAAARAQ